MKKIFTTAAVIVLAATQSFAGALTADGVATGQAASEMIEFGADHRIMHSRVNYTKIEMDLATHPMNALKGPCFGILEMRGGAVQGNGVCVFKGLEGDSVLLGWVARRINPKGEVIGYWTVNNGTGQWLQASGGGTFVSNVNPSNGTAVNTLKGAITLR